jgi:hypothetical protein
MTTAARDWGSRAAEREMSFPCDRHLPDSDLALHRAVDVDAPAAILFRWLCQLRVAPYSYDLIDNLGRRSPRRLTPGLERLEVGQRFMTIFRLVEFEQDRHVTLLHRGPAGAFAVTYMVVPRGAERSRLLVRLAASGSWLVRRFGPTGDLVMMRRQLLTLKRLAEREQRRTAMPPLPHVDEHSASVDRGPEETWEALQRVLSGGAARPARLLTALLDTADRDAEPLLGFHVARSEPPRLLDLEGEHRFARYRLRFELEPIGPDRTRITAVTDADFPGAAGTAYRALVIGTRGHVLAVRRLLGAVANAARRTPRRTARPRP